MIVLQAHGHGLGATPTYNCNNPSAPTICYGTSPETDAAFRALQTTLNRYAVKAGFQLLTVDGKIGDKTAVAAQKAVAFLQANAFMDTRTIWAVSVVGTRAAVAANVVALNTLFAEYANKLNIIQEPAAPSHVNVNLPSLPQLPGVIPDSGGGLPFGPASAGNKLHWAWYLVGVAGALGIAFLGWQWVKSRGDNALPAYDD
jgi:hypothetical protein